MLAENIAEHNTTKNNEILNNDQGDTDNILNYNKINEKNLNTIEEKNKSNFDLLN